jgi:UDP-glucose 4-epimerase
MNLLAAAAAEGSAVRTIVLKTSTLVYGSNFDDPYFFRETTRRTHAPATPVERSLVEVDALVADFVEDHPEVAVTSLRFANVLGDDVNTVFSRMLRMPAVPEVFGYDPRLQFVHEDDVTRALAHATKHDVRGTFNVAGPGVITWGEACRAVARRRLAMPPVFTGAARLPLRLLRVIDIPPEVLNLLRYGRGVDTTAFVQAGFEYRYTTPATVEAFARARRLERVVGTPPAYEYEHDVEDFFRNSRAVVRPEG